MFIQACCIKSLNHIFLCFDHAIQNFLFAWSLINHVTRQNFTILKMFSCVDVDLYLFLRNVSVHKNRFLFRSSFFLKTIIELSFSLFVSLLISEYLLLSFNELLDIIIREVVSTCDEIWKLLCKKFFWEQNARIESFVIDALTEKSLTENARTESLVIDALTKESLTENTRTKSFVIDVLTEKSLTNESLRNRSFVNNAFLDSNSLTEWFLNLLNVDSIILDVWYSSI